MEAPPGASTVVGSRPVTDTPLLEIRGLSKTFLGTARYTIDANRSIAFEGSLRQNGDGAWLRTEYSQAVGQHWRATVNFTLIRGEPAAFLGQYRRNSHLTVFVRYNF